VKCDRCDNEATVHELRVENNVRREKHLCDQCARAEGITPQAAPAPITALLSQFVTQQSQAAACGPGGAAPAGQASPTAKVICPGCGTNYAQFRQSGILGCEKCYETFESQLTPLIARAHEGGTHHAGKVPAASGVGRAAIAAAQAAVAPVAKPAQAAPAKQDERLIADRIAMLKNKLAEAIATEQYEQAAKIRDELHQLQAHPAKAPAPAATSTPTPVAKRKPKAHGDDDKPAAGSGGHR
jgi:protein arginine kinase activator